MKENLIKDKTFAFAVRVVKLSRHLNDKKREYTISHQILKSGTSIGANVREAINGESKADFIHKLGIAQKEADETLYWLELLKETGFITAMEFQSMSNDLISIIKILKSIIISTKQKKNS